VATADLYPRFSLNGYFGFEAADPGRLFNMNARTWSIGPAVRWNAFDAGRIRRTIEASDAAAAQTLATYENTLLLAIEEVENAVVSYDNEQLRRGFLNQAVVANERAVQLAEDRYISGVGAFLDVLDTQRVLYDAREELVTSDAEVSLSLVSLYRALGGGWQTSADSPAGDPVTPHSSAEQPTSSAVTSETSSTAPMDTKQP
jgi:outer membrane protein TolC